MNSKKILDHGTEPVSTQQGFSFIEFESDSPFVKLEKNLIEIGFFSIPKYRNGKKEPKQEKVIKLLNFEEHGIEAKVEILTHRRYGLPTTGDLTKYLAFTRIVSELTRAGRRLDEPIEFTHYELLKQAKLAKSQKAYADITEWLLRMKNTEILLHGELRIDKRDLLTSVSVFDKVMIAGQINEFGEKEKYNRVWLSDWTRNNILENPLIPVDFETYQKLQNDFAKLLTSHLQVWLFASRKSNIFQKNYNQFCNLVGMTQKTHPSKILQQITPALDELVKYEYVAKWSLRNGPGGYKIVIHHGKKFFRDLKQAFYVVKEKPDELYLNLKSLNSQDEHSEIKPDVQSSEIFNRLLSHGISRNKVEELVRNNDSQLLKQKLEYAEFAFNQRKNSITNRAGYILTVINSENGVPEWFESQIVRPVSGAESSVADSQVSFDFTRENYSYIDIQRYQFERFCFENKNFDLASLPLYERFKGDFADFSSQWTAIVEKLKKKVSEQVYSDWFSSLIYGGFHPDHKLIYLISSTVTSDWISRNYQNQLNDVLGSEYRIRFLEPLVSLKDDMDDVQRAYQSLVFSEIVTKYQLDIDSFQS